MVSFALYLLFVVLLDLGRASLATQTVQGASSVLASELARAPLPATFSFDQAMTDPRVTQSIYDPEALVLVIAPGETQQQIDARFAQLPIVNQMLRPLMFRDALPDGTSVIRYPGALVSTPGGGLSVFIPEVVDRAWDGNAEGGFEQIVFRPVVEEVHDPNAAPNGHFPINSGSALAGFVSVRCNYPYQASAMTGYYAETPGVFGPNHAAEADDSRVIVAAGGELPMGYDLVIDGLSDTGTPYDGRFGLGFHYLGRDEANASPRKVRPFRKLLSVQAAARREIIVPQ